MPTNAGQNNYNDKWTNAKFVERTEMAVMQFVILSKAKEGNGVTRENLQQAFRGNLKMSGDHFDQCLGQLVQEGHLRQEGNKYTITDDGREDVQKLQPIFVEVVQVVAPTGQQPRSGMQQPAGQTGGASSGTMNRPQGSMGSGNVGGSGSSQGQGGPNPRR